MKNVRSSQPCISMDFYTEFTKEQVLPCEYRWAYWNIHWQWLNNIKNGFLTLSYICIAIYYEHKLQEINMNKWCFFPKTVLCQYNNCIFQRRLKELFLLPVKTVIRRILSHSEVISRYKHFRMVNYTSRSVYKHDIS